MNKIENVGQQLEQLDSVLGREIRGQDHVMPRVVSVLRRGQLGLTKLGRPRGSFLFLGPTGVGKTELTLTFTRHLFGDEKLLRFDMSEYQTQDSLGILLGSRPGERGLLGTAFQRAQAGTILFDEVEKAHPRIMDVFLQILDAARVTMADGQTLDLSNFYVVMTSNIGSAELLNLEHSSDATLERHVLMRAQQTLRPEIFARIAEKIVFHRLSYEHQLEISEKFLSKEIEFLGEKGYALSVDSSVLSFLVRKGFHPKLGARPMRDAVEKFVGDAVSGGLLQSGKADGILAVDERRDCLMIR